MNIMQYLANFFQFAQQCCDADIYLELGRKCAEEGMCYNNLRPMGAVLWFSLPYRLGLAPSSLIIGHGILLFVSLVLSVFVARRFYQQHLSRQANIVISLLFLLGSTAAHVIFLWPILNTSLSDAPANLLALIATWLLLISPTHNIQRVLTFSLAGIALGFAAWIRAFYLYPLLVLLGLSIPVWLYKRRCTAELLLLLALIPILIQFINTRQQSGHFSFLDPQTSEGWINVHLSSTITGYDTILPFDYHAWYAPCERYSSLLDAVKAADLKSVACVIGGRIYFYLGSYSPHTYLSAFEHEQPPVNIPNFNLLPGTENSFSITKNNFIEQNAERIQFTNANSEHVSLQATELRKIDINRRSELSQTIYLERGNIYQILVSLWSAKSSHSINVEVRDHETQKTLARTGVLLTPTLTTINEPNDSITNVVIDKNGLYDIGFSSEVYDSDTVPGRAAAEHNIILNTGAFYAWDSRLIGIHHRPPPERIWSTWILILNCLAVAGSILYIRYIFSKKEAPHVIAAAFPVLCFAVALIIVPEQRFAIYPVITFWVYSFIWLTSMMAKQFSSD